MPANLRLFDIKTCGQTGNAVAHAKHPDTASLPDRIDGAIERRRGFAPEAILLRFKELQTAIEFDPFPAAAADPKSRHLTFLCRAPRTPDLAALESIRKDSGRFVLKGKVFYFHAPEGVARSKAFPRIEKLPGASGTARSWRTACTLLELADRIGAFGMLSRSG